MYGPAAVCKRDLSRVSEVADMYPALYEANFVKIVFGSIRRPNEPRMSRWRWNAARRRHNLISGGTVFWSATKIPHARRNRLRGQGSICWSGVFQPCRTTITLPPRFVWAEHLVLPPRSVVVLKPSIPHHREQAQFQGTAKVRSKVCGPKPRL